MTELLEASPTPSIGMVSLAGQCYIDNMLGVGQLPWWIYTHLNSWTMLLAALLRVGFRKGFDEY